MIKKQEISATIIADSRNQFGQRITTAILVFPRIVLAEFNTHRVFSRNSASSRAIPFKKAIKMIKEDPFIPIKWMEDHVGMQGNKFFTNTLKIKVLTLLWLFARNMSILVARILSGLGLTKQIVNRLLEPWMWHKVLLTSTEFENFFSLRADPQAEIHIENLAQKLLKAMNRSTPVLLQPGEWHIPFLKTGERKAVSDFIDNHDTLLCSTTTGCIMIATARCARVSYNNFDGSNDYGKDIVLHDRLKSSGHWSPFEHSARAMTEKEYNSHIAGSRTAKSSNPKNRFPVFPPEAYGWSGNFRGFIQYRKEFSTENRKDERLTKK